MFYENIDENINKIKLDFNESKDIKFRKINFKNDEVLLVYNDALTDSKFINEFIIEPIVSYKKISIFKNKFKLICNLIEGNNIIRVKDFTDLYDYLTNGFSILFVGDKCIAIESRRNLSRSISEPIIEQTISGPKDAFCEDFKTNVGLVRKRIKSNNFVVEETVIGRESKTRIGILYMKNIIENDLLKEIKEKINSINIDGVFDSTYISQILKSSNSAFATIESTERPDFASMQLLEGKICILVENSPFVLLIPTFFIDLFHSPEDYYQIPKNVTFTRLIRIISFFIAIILPAFYIAITTFNHETIPITLIVNFASQNYGVPFPTVVEALGMILIFEILRESDIRMPSTSGSAISILGAIVLGDAAVTAGIVSPIMVIIIAASSICSLMFSHVAMVNAIRLWKIIFIIFASFFGLVGIVLGIFLLLIEICSLKSFGKPYLYPIIPLNTNFLNDTFILRNIRKRQKRNPLLTDTNYTRSRL